MNTSAPESHKTLQGEQLLSNLFAIKRTWNWLWWKYDVSLKAQQNYPAASVTTATSGAGRALKIMVHDILPEKILSDATVKNITGDESSGVLLKIAGKFRYLSQKENRQLEGDSEKQLPVGEQNKNELRPSDEIEFVFSLKTEFKEFFGSSGITYHVRQELNCALPLGHEAELRKQLTPQGIIAICERGDRLVSDSSSGEIVQLRIKSIQLNLNLFKPSFLSSSFGFAPKVMEGLRIDLELPMDSDFQDKTGVAKVKVKAFADQVRSWNYLPFYEKLSYLDEVFKIFSKAT